jgi:hypothetical protein
MTSMRKAHHKIERWKRYYSHFYRINPDQPTSDRFWLRDWNRWAGMVNQRIANQPPGEEEQ